MTPLEYYYNQCGTGSIIEDQEQLAILHQLEKITSNLLLERQERSKFFAFLRKPRSVNGLYMWGGVGIGKTFLMDCFYQCVPFEEKTRMHFHQFMQFVHSQLKKYQGKKEPLKLIAQEVAQKTLLLCFDELFVSDIADAMLLGRLLRELFSLGVCLVATSNIAPDDLYKNGLQRQLFLPAIETLKKHTVVAHIPTMTDYRLRHLKNAGVFYTPHDAKAHANMEKTFSILANNKSVSYEPIEICERNITIKKQAGDIVWFDFDAICNVPRSQHDYLEIAKKYSTVFISHIPIIPPNAINRISLLIHLIDIFYDARVRLVFSAATAVEKIYSEGSMHFEYKRACSRLLEMQSESYFSTYCL